MRLEKRSTRPLLAVSYIASAAFMVPLFSFLRSALGVPMEPFAPIAALAAFAPVAVLHECVHYLAARRYSPGARIVAYPKMLSLMLDYGKLNGPEYLKVALAPMLTIQPVLVFAALAFPSEILVLLVVYHLASSSVDLAGAALVAARHLRDSIYTIRGKDGEIVGFIAVGKKRAVYYTL